jgi:transcriptional regulator
MIMRPRRLSESQEMLQGTMDMLILRTLILGPAHGHTIARIIEQTSEDVLQVEQGSLYPALYRLADKGWVRSYWGTSENNRKAKYYKLTPAGRRQLVTQTSRWEQMVGAIGRILNLAKSEK